ncbi:MAG: type IX secretion system membrane protein PorP/SprF [Imperialibacter sp.]|uniref:PorP/SprF family type IX secretion system membrane protein n=1 Tax=Imperialibacter sp. TaxID=2038411 RepID=UPI0032EB0127
MKSLVGKLLMVLSAALMATVAYAQQDPLYNQYLTNPMTVNPAYAGVHNRLSAGVNYRAQWTNLDDGPRTMTASGYSSFFKNMISGGLIVLQDQVSFVRNSEVYAVGAYKISSPTYKLSFGLQAGVLNSRIDYSKLVLDPDNSDDPVFVPTNGSTKVNFGTGAVFTADRLLLGVSVPRLSKSSLPRDSQGNTSYKRTAYLMGAFLVRIDEETDLKPSVLIRAVEGVPLSYDLGMTWIGNRTFSFGLFTRNLDIFGALAGVKLQEKIQFNYTFEIPTNKSLGYQYGTHEISIRLDLKALPFQEIEPTNF